MRVFGNEYGWVAATLLVVSVPFWLPALLAVTALFRMADVIDECLK